MIKQPLYLLYFGRHILTVVFFLCQLMQIYSRRYSSISYLIQEAQELGCFGKGGSQR